MRIVTATVWLTWRCKKF